MLINLLLEIRIIVWFELFLSTKTACEWEKEKVEKKINNGVKLTFGTKFLHNGINSWKNKTINEVIKVVAYYPRMLCELDRGVCIYCTNNNATHLIKRRKIKSTTSHYLIILNEFTVFCDPMV